MLNTVLALFLLRIRWKSGELIDCCLVTVDSVVWMYYMHL